MMMCRRKWFGMLSIGWSFVICLGCLNRVPPTAYYTLSSMAEKKEVVDAKGIGRYVIGLGPLALPDYLDRPYIVTRVSPNQVAVNEGYRWAGALQSEALRVIATNMEILTHARQVVTFPWGITIEPDVRIRIDIQAFEGNLGGKAQLKAVWSLTRRQWEQPVMQRVSEIETSVNGDDFDSLAQAMGELLADLSQQMAEAVSK